MGRSRSLAGAACWPLPFATKKANRLPAYKKLANTAFAGAHPVQGRAYATIGVEGEMEAHQRSGGEALVELLKSTASA